MYKITEGVNLTIQYNLYTKPFTSELQYVQIYI